MSSQLPLEASDKAAHAACPPGSVVLPQAICYVPMPTVLPTKGWRYPKSDYAAPEWDPA